MKHLRKLAGITILLIGVFMVIALIRYEVDTKVPLLPERLEYDFNEDWRIASLDATAEAETSLPYIQKHQTDETIVFQNTLLQEFAGMTMHFSTANANVSVVLDGEEIYRQDRKDRVVNMEHFVDIPHTFSDGELKIVLTARGQNTETALGEIVLEVQDIVVVGLTGSNLVDIACCLLIIIAAMIMLVLALIRWHTGQPARESCFWDCLDWWRVFIVLSERTHCVYFFIILRAHM